MHVNLVIFLLLKRVQPCSLNGANALYDGQLVTEQPRRWLTWRTLSLAARNFSVPAARSNVVVFFNMELIFDSVRTAWDCNVSVNVGGACSTRKLYGCEETFSEKRKVLAKLTPRERAPRNWLPIHRWAEGPDKTIFVEVKPSGPEYFTKCTEFLSCTKRIKPLGLKNYYSTQGMG